MPTATHTATRVSKERILDMLSPLCRVNVSSRLTMSRERSFPRVVWKPLRSVRNFVGSGLTSEQLHPLHGECPQPNAAEYDKSSKQSFVRLQYTVRLSCCEAEVFLVRSVTVSSRM